ncbi:MAG: peptidoglycan DD-metalloendopeptidase family protein [Gammaproteobacteria bacterium]|nr:peptidoglycan DD-metalloendopeptidase family protein [Gammaproteobacteria bacterium]MCF6363859.1 peptidoglycan DD-metalloendopeptidase family protein [Gammaproteobacteria bacterium]
MNHTKPPKTVMQRDYKSLLDNPTGSALRRPRARWAGLVSGLMLFAAAGLLFTDTDADADADAIHSTDGMNSVLLENHLSEDARITLPLSLPSGAADEAAETTLATEPAVAAEPAVNWQIETVRSGDSLARIFSRLRISPQQLDRLMRTGEDTAILKRIMPGQTLRFDVQDGELQQLVVEINRLNTLHIQREGESFSTHTTTRELETRVTNASGEISSSLFLAGMDAGLSDNLIMELAGIFGWDVDFALDIRAGDRFTLLYEEKYLDGEKLRDGDILAAEFTNRSKTYRALRYTDASGRSDYYTPDGKSMRKAFIRTPVDFTRISSRFGKRTHPTLKKRKDHHGVDYAAPRGTPIKAAGDGKIVHLGRKGGYGKTIIIQHGGKYSTLYAHMSNYNRKLRRGARVKQGQTIGYVGTTGRSTGPHLHYEFRINGVHRNPLTVKLPTAAPIQAKYRDDFLAKTRVLVSQLDMLTATTVAANEHTE